MKARINSYKRLLHPAHQGDAGYDVMAAFDPIIVGEKVDEPLNLFRSIDYVEYDTGLVIAPEEGIHIHVFPRSSISKYNLVLANGVATIDNGYRETIRLRFKYVFQPNDLVFSHGPDKHIIGISPNYGKMYAINDKIGQIVFSKTLLPEVETVLIMDDTSRNKGGFGSTGR